jgi:hypothetical protein
VNSYAKAFLHVHVRSNTFGLVYLDQLLDLIKYFGKVYNLRLSNTLIYIYIYAHYFCYMNIPQWAFIILIFLAW